MARDQLICDLLLQLLELLLAETAACADAGDGPQVIESNLLEPTVLARKLTTELEAFCVDSDRSEFLGVQLEDEIAAKLAAVPDTQDWQKMVEKTLKWMPKIRQLRLLGAGSIKLPKNGIVDLIAEWLQDRMAGHCFGHDLRLDPYSLPIDAVRLAFRVSKETAEWALMSLKLQQWACESHQETKLLGSPMYAIRVTKRNVDGPVGQGVAVYEYCDGRESLIPSCQVEVRKQNSPAIVAMIDDVIESPTFDGHDLSWLRSTGPSFEAGSLIVILRRAITVVLKDVRPDRNGKTMPEWTLPLGFHEVVLNAAVPSWDAPAFTSEAAASKLAAAMDGLSPRDSLREKLQSFGAGVCSWNVDLDFQAATRKDAAILSRIASDELVFVKEKTPVWVQTGVYFSRGKRGPRAWCTETTREVYFGCVGLKLVSDSASA